MTEARRPAGAPRATGTALGPQAVRDWIAQATRAGPDKPFLVSARDDRALSYGELAGLARSMAGFLAAAGIGPGDRVLLLADNSLEQVAVYVAVLAAGATVCTAHVETNRGHLASIVPQLAPRLVVCQEGLGLEALAARTAAPCRPLGQWRADGGDGVFADLRAFDTPSGGVATSPRDDAVIYFTSGTSARPKGVALSYRELLGNAAATAAAFGFSCDERVYDYRSFSWASAQILSALAPLSVGATLVLAPKFSRSRFFADLGRFAVTVAAGNPTVINLLLQGPDRVRGAALPRLRFITSSSAPLLVEQWQRFEERFGIKVAQGYGTSETGWVAGCTGDTRRLGTVGKPLANQRVEIVDRDGRAVPRGEPGHIQVGGPQDNAYRYLAEDGALRVATLGHARTGDLGHLDADGYLHVTGRASELIIRGGVNISPVEIDNTLMRLAGIAEAATVGVPDPVYGEEVVSYVVLEPDARLAEPDVLAFCQRRLPAFKAPKRVFLCPALPKTARGKLDRKVLARRWRQQHAVEG